MSRPRPPRLSHEQSVFLLALAGGAPAVAITLILLWTGDYSERVRWTAALVIGVVWLAMAAALRSRVVRPLQTLSNLLAALREGDYSIRARGAGGEDALGLAFAEVNAIGTPLREQRLGALEAGALLRTVMEEIDVAVVAVDGDRRVRLANRAAERMLGLSVAQLLGRDARDVGLAPCLEGTPRRVIEALSPAGGRWELRRSTFRQGGHPLQLLVLSDLSRTLREEERQVWQRLVRVLSHEINNSLAPIQSIAGTLRRLLERRPRAADADEDLAEGLEVIASRSESLGRFMSSYARMARLPQPRLGAVDVAVWVRRVAGLEKRVPVLVRQGPPLVVRADGDQLDQLLINLVGNAADATLETGGVVAVGWTVSDDTLVVTVEDEGPGLPETGNLFVPFFTTKRQGSGIGLVLSRQIAEAHGGHLALENRRNGKRGAVARLELPLTN